MGLSSMRFYLDKGSGAWEFSYTGAQLHGGSVERWFSCLEFSYKDVRLHAN